MKKVEYSINCISNFQRSINL